MAKKNTIFGIRAVLEAIKAGKDIERVIMQRGLSGNLIKELQHAIKAFNVPCQYLPVEKFKKWSTKNHQGVIAILSEISYQQIEDLLPGIYEEGNDPFILILDQVSDVRNFGAITRTAECAGVHAIIVPEKGSAAINADAIKASAGALHKIPICRTKSLINTVKMLKDNGLHIVAATEKSSEKYCFVDYNKPIAIVMGSEDQGVSNNILKIADHLVRIPVNGTIESLNVSVAAGILMYESIRQKSVMEV